MGSLQEVVRRTRHVASPYYERKGEETTGGNPCGRLFGRAQWNASTLLVAVFLILSTSTASAGTAEEINALPTLDALNRVESPLSNGGKWSTLSWASGTGTGVDTTSGWGPSTSDAFPVVNGAYWNPSTFADKTGDAAAITMQASPSYVERYVALWLGMANPGSAKSGYQLRWTFVSTNTYSVTLSKWSSGVQTVLASNASVSIPAGTTMAISDTGGTVTAWQGNGGSLSSLLSAADSAYAGGYAGIEASGNVSRSTSFKAGPLLGAAITAAPVLDNLERSEVPLATGKWSKSTWASEIGGAWMGGYRGYGSNGGIAGAWWNSSSFSDAKGGDLVAGTVGTGAPNAGEYLGFWLNMPSPGSARSGYEARFTGVNGSASNYKVELSKWVSGTRTVLASKEGFSLAVGTTVGLTDAGGTISLWTGTSAMLPLLTASDSTYASGYAGLEVNGVAGTIYNFRAAGVDGNVPPTVTTEAATNVKNGEATLNAMVNPQSSAASYQFEYGTSVFYGSKIPIAAKSIASGASAVPVSETINNLSGGTTYHYRIVASNAGGSVTGADKTFTGVGPPQTTITSGPGEAKVYPSQVNFLFASSVSGSTFECSFDGAPYSSCASPTSYPNLPEGTHWYIFKVRAKDPTGSVDPTPAERKFQVMIPPVTSITSPKPTYTNGSPPPVAFTSNEAGSTFKCSLDDPKEEAKTACTSPYTLPSNLGEGWHTFVVLATDPEGNPSVGPARYTFNLADYPAAPATSKIITPEEGTTISHFFTLKAEWGAAPSGGGVTGVTFQYKINPLVPFKTISAKYATDALGREISWPLPISTNPGKSEPVYFDARHFFTGKWPTEWGPAVSFRAVFDGGKLAAGTSETVKAVINTGKGGSHDASEQVGPATINLVTGSFTFSRTDVSIPVPGTEANLEFTRTYDSTYHGGKVPTNVLGGMWQPSQPVEQGTEGEAWQGIVERAVAAVPPIEEEEEEIVEAGEPESRWIELLSNEGYGVSFEFGPNGTFISPDYAKDWILSREGENFVLADANGTHTVFIPSGSGSWAPKSISWQASANSARMVYEHINGTDEQRLTAIIGPASVTCGDTAAPTTPGCRTLTFQYQKGKTPDKDRLASITYHNATGANAQVVAQYAYDALGKLTEEWDPRLPSLKERYIYNVNNELKSITPPGQEPWEFLYYFEVEGEQPLCCDRPLKAVRRATLLSSPSVAQTSIVYDVPISGTDFTYGQGFLPRQGGIYPALHGDAPYDMSGEAVAKWGQTDIPRDATAIFSAQWSPGETPDYSKAVVKYMDADGYLVNTASATMPGATGPSITTAEADGHGNIIRSLSAQNRLFALEAEDSVARSLELDSHSTYNSDGTEMLESWGPLHKVRLDSGKTVKARSHAIVKYDEGAPTPKAGEPKPHLPTKETTTAAIPGKADEETRITEIKYDWTLRKPTETITDPQGLNLRSITVYNSAGQVKESRQPSDLEGKTAGTSKTVYWTAGGNTEQSACGEKAIWAGLPCVTYPAADPTPAESNPKLPWTWFKAYSNGDQPTEIQEKANGILKRTTIVTYDSAGRPVKVKQTGEGISLPAVETTYSEANGGVTSQYFACEVAECAQFDSQEVSRTYDKLGRMIKYMDADGNVSEVAYDLLNRPVLVSDGKGTQATVYDQASGLPVKLIDSAAGTFTASYDADGRMTQQLLPNGLAQQIGYDETGGAVNLGYEKTSYCSSSCTWLQFSREESIRGQVLTQQSTLSSEEYAYDKAGRLVLAKQTPNIGGCSTRAYVYDKDSNRTSVTARGPKQDGVCDTESAGAKQSNSYDTADRLIGGGVVYDNLGRITSLPSTYSGGGTLSTSYYVNNQVRSQTQDGLTNTYELDSTARQRMRTQSGSNPGTEIYHYANGSDSPAWIQEGSGWSRNIGTLGGSLGAIQESSGEITLQLADMHGDIIATADINPQATKLLSTQSFDEFGNPLQEETARYGWLGSKGRRTEFPSGLIQMGVRSYVPAMGRFISPDPVAGGSASAYDYSNADPVNGFDLTGEKPVASDYGAGCSVKLNVHSRQRKNPRKNKRFSQFDSHLRIKCTKTKAVVITIHKIHITYEKARGDCGPFKHFCKGPYCNAESDCTDYEPNVGSPSPRSLPIDEEDPCELGVEYQMHVTITISMVSVLGVIGSGKGPNPGSLAGPQNKSFDLTAQQYCGHGKY